MHLQRPLLCPLVRFVHARCGVQSKEVAAGFGAQRLQASQLQELAAAVRTNCPAVISSIAPSAAGASQPLLQRIRALSGFRDVPVRLRRSQASGSDATFGDARKAALYSSSELWRVYRVVDELVKAGEAGPRCYGANIPLEARLPEVAAELLPVMEKVEGLARQVCLGAAVPMTPSLYFGAGEQRTPLHFDPTENITVCMQGEKFYRLFPPSDVAGLQARGGFLPALGCRVSGVVPAVYSDLDAWAFSSPEDAHARIGIRYIDIHLREGEAMYLPAAWWHATGGSREPNVSVVFGFVSYAAG